MTARRRKRGRPPKLVSDARPCMVMIRLHREEHRLMAAAAKRDQAPLASWIRSIVLNWVSLHGMSRGPYTDPDTVAYRTRD